MNEERKEETVDVIKRDIITLVKMAQKPFTWLHGSMAAFNILCLIAATFVGTILYRNTINNAAHLTHEVQLLNTNFLIQNQQTTLLKIIDKNLRDSNTTPLGSAPMEEKVKLSQIFYQMSTLKQVPLSLLCGIAEVESSWNTHAVSNMGCKGILQVNPTYARPYLREKGINYGPDIWFDPVVNALCGISMLADYQDDAIEKGLAKNDWTFSTRSYFWGPSSRGNVLDMNYSIKVINASKKYQRMGLL